MGNKQQITEWRDKSPAEKIKECREIMEKYPDDHPQRAEIEKQIEKYEDKNK